MNKKKIFSPGHLRDVQITKEEPKLTNFTTLACHKKRCRICKHPEKTKIEKILAFPTMDIEKFCEVFGFDVYTIKSTIIRHSNVLNLKLEQLEIADWVNYFMLWDLSNPDRVDINNKLKYNDQQQKREGKYKDVVTTDHPVIQIALFQEFFPEQAKKMLAEQAYKQLERDKETLIDSS